MKKILFLALLSILCSCSEKKETEVLSVNPTSMSFGSEASKKSLEISANCRWSGEVKYESSQKDWLTLSTKGAQRGATVTVGVKENDTEDTRKATIEITTEGGLKSVVSISQDGLSYKPVSVKLCTYNMRMSTSDTSSDTNNWSVRKVRLWKSVEALDFDICGLQELTAEMITDIQTQFSKTYGFYIFSPYAQDGVGTRMAIGIMYKCNEFTISEKHFFWPSATPGVMNLNDVGTNGDYKRGGCCCILTHKGTGNKIFFMVTHACLNPDPNAKWAYVYADMEKKYNPSGLPSFYVGDLNARPTYSASKTYLLHWKDSFLELPSSKKSGSEQTYNGYSKPEGISRLDYIYYRGEGATPLAYRCDNSLYDGLFASDHFPVLTEFKITK